MTGKATGAFPGKVPIAGRKATRPKPGNQPWKYVKPRVASRAAMRPKRLSQSFPDRSHHIRGHGAWQKGKRWFSNRSFAG